MEETPAEPPKRKRGRPRISEDEKQRRFRIVSEQRERLRVMMKVKDLLPRQILAIPQGNPKLASGPIPTPGIIKNGEYKFASTPHTRIKELTPEAIEVIAELMRYSTNDFCRLAAAKDLLDRGLGRPGEQVSHKHDHYAQNINIRKLTPALTAKMTEVIDELEKKLPED